MVGGGDGEERGGKRWGRSGGGREKEKGGAGEGAPYSQDNRSPSPCEPKAHPQTRTRGGGQSPGLTGVVGHQLLQAVELGAGRDVEAAAVQLADLVVLHVEALGVVEIRHGEAVGTCKAGPESGSDPHAPHRHPPPLQATALSAVLCLPNTGGQGGQCGSPSPGQSQVRSALSLSTQPGGGHQGGAQ